MNVECSLQLENHFFTFKLSWTLFEFQNNEVTLCVCVLKNAFIKLPSADG